MKGSEGGGRFQWCQDPNCIKMPVICWLMTVSWRMRWLSFHPCVSEPVVSWQVSVAPFSSSTLTDPPVKPEGSTVEFESTGLIALSCFRHSTAENQAGARSVRPAMGKRLLSHHSSAVFLLLCWHDSLCGSVQNKACVDKEEWKPRHTN